jgi:hypothetical protein
MHDAEIQRITFDLGDFRRDVATYVRLLIAARLKRESSFLSREKLAGWGLPHPRYDKYPEWRLLELAAQCLGRLNDVYLPRCGSAGVAPTDETTAEGRLINRIAFFAPYGGGGPLHNGELAGIAERVRNGESLDWQTQINWSELSEIRDDLNQLPDARRPGPWSRPRPPQEWTKLYDMSWDTLKKLFEEQKIRNEKLSPKLYRVFMADLPPSVDG